MRRHRRLILLLLVLALAADLVLFDDPGGRGAGPAIATARPIRSATERPSAPADSATLLALRPRVAPETPPNNAFVARDWTPPPPPPPPPSPPPPPLAPPLPFQFLGKQMDDGQWQVFLGRQDRTYVVRTGDVIEGTYHVDQIAPPLLTLTYLPLKQPQTLSIGMH